MRDPATVDRVCAILAAARETAPASRPADIVWQALEDAVEVIEGLPDRERAWLRNPSRVWAMASLSPAELRQNAKADLMAGIKPEPVEADAAAMDLEDALLVLDWLKFCRDDGEGRLQKAAFYLAAHKPEVAIVHLHPGRPFDRKLTNHIRVLASAAIQKGLRDHFGIEIAHSGALIVDEGA